MLIEFEYGLDAPPVVRNMLLISGALLLLAALGAIGVLPDFVTGLTLWPGFWVGFGAGTMIWSSKIGKLRRREKLLNRLAWRGSESVLDIGCGRGLMLIGAAKRVPNGHATGIDIWQAEDLSGNSAAAVAVNASREHVTDRITVETADMRSMPFADRSFDVVVSSTAIHNIYDKDERAKAIREIDRVLKPGGQLLIDDIRHLDQYAEILRGRGWSDPGPLHPVVIGLFWRVVTFGSLHPGTLVATKP